ncbi:MULTISPECIES: MDR family oxidoreductase [unclassified Shewanella]|uniref:acrylyl-CoA reductase (NADPH) n=1 Tax=unclassified Shewanella TaxID=196818 RepID=UPI000C82E0A3|nr:MULTISPECIES: MDR family oxidoreductase [unclassified Shewanella]PMG29520.1 quinone oxidoreductase [Shewanella sp. 10N.286.52.C2]PMH88898.1 quinone oxidoreductase [Shewanella sp. 10N.286.48.B5]PMI00076.1 quinone oxidoreductase [Shewanella sp. 10N.286.48.A6]
MFNALVLTQNDKQTQAEVRQLSVADLPEGEVLVDVSYSSLNYKDGLAVTGLGKIIRNFPMVPGIDFAGVVSESADPRYKAGDEVILTGWGVGENHWGGMAQKARVKADWLVPMPQNADAAKAMMVGTAGLTAMLCVQALQQAGVTPEQGEVLVTGASGGVGSVAVTLLSALGYRVVASSGRVESNGELLKQLGASEVIDRSEFEQAGRPLDKQRWAGVVDTVGNQVLATALTQINYGGSAAICGLAGGFALPTTVMPFILRGVNLLGVDSVACPFEKRVKAWEQVIALLPESFYQQACQTVALEQVPEFAQQIVKGKVTGRVLVNCQ